MINLPNTLSFARLVLSPLLVFVSEEYLLFLFFPLAFSDALDGFLARRLKAQTELGKVLDPLADKVMLLCGLFVCTFKLQLIPQALFYSVLARDLFLLVGGTLLTSRHKTVPQARVLGKVFTLTLSLFIILCLGGFFSQPIFWAVVVLTFLSWLDYTLFGLKSVRSQTSSLI